MGLREGSAPLIMYVLVQYLAVLYVLYDKGHTSKIMLSQMKHLNSVFVYSVIKDDQYL